MSNEIKLLVVVKTRKTKQGRKFKSYRTLMNLPVVENDNAIEQKWVDLKFGKEVDQKDIDALKGRGYISVPDNAISAPFRYEITEEENENGDLVKRYPTVWVNKISHYEEAIRKPSQSSFVTESDTEETEIQ